MNGSQKDGEVGLEDIHGLGKGQGIGRLDHIADHDSLHADLERLWIDLDHRADIVQSHVRLRDIPAIADRLDSLLQSILLTTVQFDCRL